MSPQTRAIVVPHTLGNPVDLDVISALCKQQQLYLVEDTCDALGGARGVVRPSGHSVTSRRSVFFRLTK